MGALIISDAANPTGSSLQWTLQFKLNSAGDEQEMTELKARWHRADGHKYSDSK